MIDPGLLAFSIGAGFIAGLVHVLSGPDHLAAVAPLAVDAPVSRRWTTGLRWGLGHSGGAITIGLIALATQSVFHARIISGVSERLVGIMLIGIGLWAIIKAIGYTRERVQSGAINEESVTAHNHARTAFAVGLLHGLAGGSHILGVLPALALPSATASVCYLLFFGVGTVAGMMGFASFAGSVVTFFGGGPMGRARLMGTCGVCAIAVGAVWIG